MPIDEHGRWWRNTALEGFNNPAVDPPPIPDGPDAILALREHAAWVRLRREQAPRVRLPDLDLEERPHNRQWLKKFQQLIVSDMKPAECYNCGVILSKFKVEYDSHEQISQKLMNTVILVRGWPFIVSGTILQTDGSFALLLSDQHAHMVWVRYADIDDLRSMAPGYVNHASIAYWVHRLPDRQNQQGMSSRNTFMKAAGTDERSTGMHTNTMLACLHSRRNIPFQPNLMELMDSGVMTSVRLSNNLALYKVKNKGAACGIEYIGRPLGLIVDNRLKVLDEADLAPTWIHKDCNEVNLELF